MFGVLILHKEDNMRCGVKTAVFLFVQYCRIDWLLQLYLQEVRVEKCNDSRRHHNDAVIRYTARVVLTDDTVLIHRRHRAFNERIVVVGFVSLHCLAAEHVDST